MKATNKEVTIFSLNTGLLNPFTLRPVWYVPDQGLDYTIIGLRGLILCWCSSFDFINRTIAVSLDYPHQLEMKMILCPYLFTSISFSDFNLFRTVFINVSLARSTRTHICQNKCINRI